MSAATEPGIAQIASAAPGGFSCEIPGSGSSKPETSTCHGRDKGAEDAAPEPVRDERCEVPEGDADHRPGRRFCPIWSTLAREVRAIHRLKEVLEILIVLRNRGVLAVVLM